MNAQNKVFEQETPSAGAGLAGAGGGTLLTFISATMPDGSAFKPWVLYLAPSAAILLSTIWLWTQRKIASHFREREVRQLFDDAKATLQAALNNPSTTEEHRKWLRDKLQELEMLDVTRAVDRIRTLRILDSADISFMANAASTGVKETATEKTAHSSGSGQNDGGRAQLGTKRQGS